MSDNFRRNQSGTTAIEYGLIAALIAVAIIAGLTALGHKTLPAEQPTTQSDSSRN